MLFRSKVTGTQFDVRSALHRVRVAVLEGEVNVMQAVPIKEHDGGAADVRFQPELMADTRVVVLGAGQQVIKPQAQDFQAVKPISELELSAWRRDRLVYLDASLVDVIGDANRYFDGTIALDGAKLADLRVTATIRTDQVGVLPDMLAQSLPIVVRKSTANDIVIVALDQD